MNIDDLSESRYLTKNDCGKGMLLTIVSLDQQEIDGDEGTSLKYCLHFSETEKPLILKTTTAQLIAGFLGSKNTDDWIGRKIVLFNDPTVTMRGKVTGGIRARAPKNQPAQTQPAPVPGPVPLRPRQEQPRAIEGAQEEPPSDDVPF